MKCVEPTTEFDLGYDPSRRGTQGYSVFQDSFTRYNRVGVPYLMPGFIFKCPEYPRGLLVRPLIHRAIAAMQDGHSNKEVCRRTLMAMRTAKKLRVLLEEYLGKKFLCLCGQPASHQKSCDHRASGGRGSFAIMRRCEERNRQIIAELESRPGLTIEQIRQVVGLTWGQAYHYLSRLIEAGTIRRRKVGGLYRHSLNERGMQLEEAA